MMRPSRLLLFLLFCQIWVLLGGCNLDLGELPLEQLAEIVVPTMVQVTVTPNRPLEATVTPTHLPQPLPLPTSTPTPIPTLQPRPRLTHMQLTQGGCCVQPFFSADGNTVLFIDKPSPDAVVGIYGIDLSTFISPGESPPRLIDEHIGFYSPDQSIVAFPDVDNGNLMRFINRDTDQTWTVDTLGNWPVFSPDGSHIYWNATARQGPYDEQPTDIWIAQMDGSEARPVMTIYGGGANGWFPDNDRLLITGRDQPIGEVETLWVFSTKDGSPLDLAQEKRLRSSSISPDGAWVVYLTTFSGDAEQDGLWAVRADNSQRQKLPFFGPSYWLNNDTLIFIPLRQPDQAGFALWQFNVLTQETTRLTDPDQIPLKIQDGDWAVSPDGQWVVYVSALDQNLWLIELP